jgi:hypothetical protein
MLYQQVRKLSSEMLRLVVWQELTDVSQMLVLAIMRPMSKQSAKMLLDTETGQAKQRLLLFIRRFRGRLIHRPDDRQ